MKRLTPPMGVLGWVGLTWLAVAVGFGTGVSPHEWWQLLLLWVFGVMVPVELIRIDAIQQAILTAAQHVRGRTR